MTVFCLSCAFTQGHTCKHEGYATPTLLQEVVLCNVTMWLIKNLHRAPLIFCKQQKDEVVTYVSLRMLQLNIDWLNEGVNMDLSPRATLVQTQIDDRSAQLEIH